MTTSYSEVKKLQERAASDIVKNSIITVVITNSQLVFSIDIRDIFRWERALVKKQIHFQMTDRRTGLIVGKFTTDETVQVPVDYLGRLMGR